MNGVNLINQMTAYYHKSGNNQKTNMTHTISIADATVKSFREALASNKTSFVEASIEEGRTHFILDLKFANELFYLGASYGINSLGNSVAESHDPVLSN